jgi:hypothetical protein
MAAATVAVDESAPHEDPQILLTHWLLSHNSYPIFTNLESQSVSLFIVLRLRAADGLILCQHSRQCHQRAYDRRADQRIKLPEPVPGSLSFIFFFFSSFISLISSRW